MGTNKTSLLFLLGLPALLLLFFFLVSCATTRPCRTPEAFFDERYGVTPAHCETYITKDTKDSITRCWFLDPQDKSLYRHSLPSRSCW